MPAYYGNIKEMIPEAGMRTSLSGLSPTAAAYIFSQIVREQPSTYVVFLPTPLEVEDFIRDLEFFWPEGAASKAILQLPGYEIKPFSGQSPAVDLVFDRLWALYSMMSGQTPLVVAASAQSALQLSMPGAELSKAVDFLQMGQEVDRDEFIENLVKTGHISSPMVQGPGDFSVRGGILDIYPPGVDRPVRAEFFGDFIESLRIFRTLDQRSVKDLEELVVIPANEVIYDDENTDRALDRFRTHALDNGWPGDVCAKIEERLERREYFPGLESFLPLFYDQLSPLDAFMEENTKILFFDRDRFKQVADDFLNNMNNHINLLRDEHVPSLYPELLFQTPNMFMASVENRGTIEVNELDFSDREPSSRVNRKFNFKIETNHDLRALMESTDPGSGLLAPLAVRVKTWLERNLDIELVCHTEEQAKRLAELLESYNLHAERGFGRRKKKAESGGNFRVNTGFLASGFVMESFGCVFVSEEELFGPKHRLVRRAAEEIKGVHLSTFQDLSVGDFVVHTDHGVGQYQGLVSLEVGDFSTDFLQITYKGDDRLYVPVDKFGAVQKYIGSEGIQPKLDKLGGEAWEKIKAKVKASIMEMAEDLIKLYASRKARKGYQFSAPGTYYHEFEAGFEFEETPDQLNAIEDVMKGMDSDMPMDRLVCGDVGYGKTEVAMRAAFRATLDSKQVAILVPTTVLAEQHYQSFSARFKQYPVQVEVLSRFKTKAEQKEILERLALGRVDIIIGTHRLISKDVKFKDLGLLVIDEEHRFGVAQKEKLKKLRTTVDVLALSATPIPRSLQMSLTAIRDLSTIETPPRDRRAIKSYLLKYDESIICEAIAHELERGGQVFLVHNRVKDIDQLAARFKKLMPLVNFGIAHGQQRERELEKVMLRFLNRKIDVLVCTTIIESGLDIPSANTIIINNADKFGMAQIYQLRGRVGRSDKQAYAYLLVKNEDTLTTVARKRLKALMDFSDLGAGFKIALHDLQIRGAGNLLGVAQSGQVAAIGYEMYMQLMEQAVRELKGESQVEKIEPELVIHLPAYIPEEYIEDSQQRLVNYRRFSSMDKDSELSELCDELVDRYGKMPVEVVNLIKVIELKMTLADVGIKKLEIGQGGLTLSFAENGQAKPQKLVRLVSDHPGQARLYPDGRLFLSMEGLPPEQGLETARNILQEIV